MPQPFNYTLNVPAPDISGNFVKGMAIRDAMDQRQAAEQQKIAQAQMQTDLAELSKNPTVSTINTVMAKYPQMADKFKPLLESVSAEQKQSKINMASDVFMALGSGKREIAMKILDEQAAAARNSGDEQGAKSTETMRELISSAETGDAGDKLVLASAGSFLSAAMGPENFAKAYEGILNQRRAEEKAPAELQKAQADASKAAVAAKFAESEAVLDLQKKGWDITAIQNNIEVSKQNAKIALMNASLARESNDLKRQELALKIQDAQVVRDEKVREKTAEAETALGTIDDAQAVLTDLFSDEDSLRAAIGAGSIRARVPGSKAKSVAGKIDRLQNIFASANLDKLKGSMSDKDILFLKGISMSLDRGQNEEAFLKELRRVGGVLATNRERVARKFGVPATERTVEVEY